MDDNAIPPDEGPPPPLLRLVEALLFLGGAPLSVPRACEAVRGLTAEQFAEAVAALNRDYRAQGRPYHIQPREGGGIRVSVSADGQSDVLDATHLLVATGRRPNTEGLGLDAAGIKHDRTGIKVSSGLVTSNRAVFAIGDVTGGLQFTHVANYHAGIVIRRALFRLPAKVDRGVIPWVTYTDPELAHVGLSEEEARKRYGSRLSVLRWPYAENDRAQAEHATEGFVKVVTTRDGRILGASILGKAAGELIHTWSLAVSSGLNIKAMAQYVAPYPTLGEINRRAATTFFASKIGRPWVRTALRLLGGISRGS